MDAAVKLNMTKTIWQKIKQNRLLLIVLCCLVPIVLIIGFLSLFNEGSTYWIWLVILLCPILHIWMMRGHKSSELYKCPECGFWYKEKEWVDRCEAWCKKYKSCNLEITKHAEKRSSKV